MLLQLPPALSAIVQSALPAHTLCTISSASYLPSLPGPSAILVPALFTKLLMLPAVPARLLQVLVRLDASRVVQGGMGFLL